MPDAKSGLTSILADIAPTAEPPAPDAEQLDLVDLGLPQVTEAKQRYQLAPPKSGPGRRAGSRNRRTLEWADFLLARYRSPLETLAAVVNTPVAELANSLGCNALEALQEQRLCAIALLPYLHQRMPVSVNLDQRMLVQLVINEGHALPQMPEEALDDGPLTIAGAVLGTEQNQSLSETPHEPV